MSTSTDHRIRVSKTLIRKAFTELMRTKPPAGITVRELCALAGLNRGTFYAHYQDIYDLLHQIEDEMYQEIEQALEPLLTQPQAIGATEISTAIFRCLKENSDMCTVTLGEHGDKEFALRLLSLGRERYVGSIPPNMRATPMEIEYYYAFISSGCIGLLQRWLDDGMSASVEEIAQLVEGIMAQGKQYFLGDRPGRPGFAT